MANAKFDSKSFNPQAFKYLRGRVPNLHMHEIKKSRALASNPDIKAVFATQNGTAYARLAMRGLLDGDAVNYDGQTDIEATSTKTFEQGVVVIGRAKAWKEKDFSYDITGGVDFMANVAGQVDEYWDGIDQKTLISIIKGIFSMTGTQNLKFVNNHTYDITEKVDGNMSATTLNSATNKACGANKKKFTLVFMHSDVATNLENKNLVEYLKQTDANGVQRDLALYTWNGKLVVVDDDLPTVEQEGFYTKAKAADAGALEVVANTATPTPGKQIKLEDVTPVATGYTTPAEGDFVVYIDAFTEYTTYVLGNGAFSYEDIGAKVPHAMARDEKTNGGEDILYTRQRKVFSPFGISYEKSSQATLSPTDAELEKGENWSLVHSGESVAANRSYVNHKAIAIAQIKSRG
ncbi:phage coat protein [Lachnospiraceae bacterium OttesenSCG-928-D06]|nr:phage coat protein [Lachnospiraceae bacterium OttesenSCG-928-D06]